MITRRHRDPVRSGAERGTASIETVVMVPLVLFVILLVFQVAVAASTVQAASQAARDGARAYSLGDSATSAAESSLPGTVRLVEVTTFGPHHGVRVVVEAPGFLVFGDRHVTREVVMP